MPTYLSEGHFRKECLPRPVPCWKSELGKTSRPSHGWVRCKCPLHGGNNPTSFSANVETGAFYCHACGAKGGDVLDFARQRYKLSFPEAAKMLGAWSESPLSMPERRKLEEKRREAERIRAAEEQFAGEEDAIRREIVGEIRLLHRVEQVYQQQLRQNHEDQTAWESLVILCDMLRVLEVRHKFLLFGPKKGRVNFVRGDEAIRISITERLQPNYSLASASR